MFGICCGVCVIVEVSLSGICLANRRFGIITLLLAMEVAKGGFCT